ncbi:FtsW/RodA/SpoVE family cell cycle protein [Candidatus Nanosynbacter lyticus]|nr:FtsW/RodA/SpoVE family cell cycle protein [Candidatus Nanosynbacter lyticus]QCT41396.1 FtsW/RodA/SpoVE family cell cycle protein [TM7 phylum sp. oral taxon 952]
MRNSVAGKHQTSTQSVRSHRPMYQIVLYMGLLLLLGLIVMYALGPQRANVMNYAYGTNYSDTYFFGKQLTSVAIAVVAFSVFYFVPYKWFTGERSKYVLWAGFLSCVLLFLLGSLLHLSLAKETNGAYRWFYLGGLGSFQPSELLKYGVLLFLAGFLGRRASQGKINDVHETLVPVGVISALSLLMIVVLQKDLGTGVSLIAIVLSMIIVSGVDWKIIGKILGVVAFCGLVLIFTSPHRIERVMTFIQGDSHKTASGQEDKNYHIQQARIAIGSGGILGLGIGKSVQATGYLPEAINDSIFAVMGETFGFVGLMAILALFTALLLSILHVAARLPDTTLRLIVAGIFGWIASHVVLNIAAMTGLMPLTGIPLPLLSYGGTSMLFIAAALGLVFQISKYTSHKVLEEGEGGQDLSGRRRLRRTRYAGGSRI